MKSMGLERYQETWLRYLPRFRIQNLESLPGFLETQGIPFKGKKVKNKKVKKMNKINALFANKMCIRDRYWVDYWIDIYLMNKIRLRKWVNSMKGQTKSWPWLMSVSYTHLRRCRTAVCLWAKTLSAGSHLSLIHIWCWISAHWTEHTVA